MKLLGEMMRGREPNPEERGTLAHVLDITLGWQRGEMPLRQAEGLCTPHDRYKAMRFAELGSEGKHALMAFVDAILAARKDIFASPHGTIGMEEVYDGNAKAMTNHAGRRVFVWPLFSMDGVPTHPRVDLPPGEARRTAEEAAMRAYGEYRKKKRQREGRER